VEYCTDVSVRRYGSCISLGFPGGAELDADEVEFSGEQRLRKDYEKWSGFLGLQYAPELLFVESAAGAGGIFAEDVIIVGIDDAEEIARRVWRRNAPAVRALIRGIAKRGMLRPEDAFAWLTLAVVRRIIKHELGHAARHGRSHSTPYPDDEEAAADFIAGELAELAGENEELGVRIFFEIGCEGPHCEHPGPVGRVEAYRAGREAVRRWRSGR
jgi:hypothetical protein